MTDLKRLDEAMAGLRQAVERQLGVDRPAAVEVPAEALVRFSPDLPQELSDEQRAELVARAEDLQPWIQGPFLLGGGVVVGAWRSDLRWHQGLDAEVPSDLAGKRVIDIGSNAGYDAFMFKQRGWDYVLGCEPYEFHHQATFLESIYQTGVDFQQIGWQDLDPELHGRFDIVHCNGVLYHEAHPVHFLQRLRPLLADSGTLLLGTQTLAKPELSEYARFVPGSYFRDPTWWWVPGRLVVRWMLEAVGFLVQGEFGGQDRPPGEFPVVSRYYRATRGEPDPLITDIGS